MYRLLLVDDEKMALLSIRHSAQWQDFHFTRIEETTSAQTALKLLLDYRFDVAFLDIRMPGLTAFDILDTCRRRKTLTTFLILTGYSDFKYARQAIHHGVFDYLLKPLQPEELQTLLPNLVRHLWQQRLQTDPPILQRLCMGQETKALLSWLDAPLSSPWFGLLTIKSPQLTVQKLCLPDELSACCLLAAEDEAVIFLGADRDPTPLLEEYIQKLPAPCSAHFTLIGQDLSQFAALLVKIRHENARTFLADSAAKASVLHTMGYRQLPGDDDTFLTLLREIEAHFTQDLSLYTLAEKYNISYAYCSNLFSQRMGLTFSQYVRSLRLQRAKELLQNTQLPVNLIGEQTGYPDYRHFAKTFRKEFGLTPSEFRNSKK